MTLAEKILYLRTEKKIQQNKLANELGVSRQTIYKWELGACMPEFEKIKKMAQIFDVSYDVLLNDEISLPLMEKENSSIDTHKERAKSKSILTIAIIVSILIVTAIALLMIFNPFKNTNEPIIDTDTNINTDTDTDIDTSPKIEHNNDHNLEIVTLYVKASCENSGKALMHCKECDFKGVIDIKPIGHNIYEHKCTICGYIKGSDGIEYASGDGYGTNYYVKSIGTCSATDIVIANRYNGRKVVAIKREAFKNSNITSILLPDTITTIEASAFYRCTSLKSVTFSEGLKEIGEYSFYETDLDSPLKLPDSLEKIENFAFYNTGLTSIHFGSELNYIGYSAFYKCRISQIWYNGTGSWYLPSVSNKKVLLNTNTFSSNLSYIWKKNQQ